MIKAVFLVLHKQVGRTYYLYKTITLNQKIFTVCANDQVAEINFTLYPLFS